jgi:hypothetical protein
LIQETEPALIVNLERSLIRIIQREHRNVGIGRSVATIRCSAFTANFAGVQKPRGMTQFVREDAQEVIGHGRGVLAG